MSTLRRLLPSTSMLIAFDAAARTGSFSTAAREINLTHGAISRQVHALEGLLNVSLFVRAGKTVQLTETGKIYAEEIHRALQSIRNASLNAITGPLRGILNLAVLPTFGTRWLIPRFPSFLQDHPDITVNFVTKLSPFDFQQENLHSAIHYGEPDWPNTTSTFLLEEKVLPACSPAYLKNNQIKTVEDIAQVALLHLSSRADAWENWFTANGVSVQPEPGMLFEQFSILIQAAIAGMGVALLPEFLIQNELKQDELTTISEAPLMNSSGYYLITPIDKADYPPVVAFREWLLSLNRPSPS